MMRALLLLFVSLPVVAQQAAQPAPADPAKPPERPKLNLRLDNPAGFATINPDKPPAKDLPVLGGDARKVEEKPRSPGDRSEGGPYPKSPAR